MRAFLLILAGGTLALAAGPRYAISTVAGSDLVGDGGPAALAQLAGAEGVAVDAAGNVYIADAAGHRVRKVSPAGLITTVAGNGHAGFSGDGGPARKALLDTPYGVAADREGGLYIADMGNGRVRRIAPDGTIRTVAGAFSPRNVAMAGDGTLFVSDFSNHRIYLIARDSSVSLLLDAGAGLNAPAGLAVDAGGALYFADSGHHRVCKFEWGRLTTVLGGDGSLSAPTGVAVDASGNLFVADSGNRRVWKRTAGGLISVVAVSTEPLRDVACDAWGALVLAAGKQVLKAPLFGPVTRLAGDGTFGFSGDGGPALQAHLFYPSAAVMDAFGSLFIADTRNRRVRKVTADGRIETVFGDSNSAPAGLAFDPAGRLWIADQGCRCVRRMTPAGAVEMVAGSGQFVSPAGIAVDRAGQAYVADSLGRRVFSVSPGGLVTALAEMDDPRGLALDRDGNLYIAETGAGRVRRRTPAGAVETVLTGLKGPAGIALDLAGNLYIAETESHSILRLGPDGMLETIAGAATSAGLNHPAGVSAGANGEVFIADTWNHQVRKLTPVAQAEALAELRVVHAASLAPGPIAPGQLVAILDATVSEAEVLFDGTPVPVLSAREGRIVVQAPSSLAGQEGTGIEVRVQGSARGRARLAVAGVAPGLFTVAPGQGQAVAMLEDGTLNSVSNPASRGSVVVLYATGEGVSGLPVAVTLQGYAAEVLYAGPAPGFPGLLQLNVRLPSGYFPAGVLPVTLTVGSTPSQPNVTLAIR
ncbi:MAG: SMP-30/gluconolactonase/LRE family protein [Acidobacteria bacterium]|nr:SMP-30/gluconolactonase/LRE family protein [Acidobacteriota bacterium]